MKQVGAGPAMTIRPGVSRRLAIFLIILHAVSLVAVILLPVSGYWRALLACAVCGGLAHSLGGAVWHRWPWSLRQAEWQPDGNWSLTLGDGREVAGRLLGSTYVSPALVVLNFRQGRWWTRSLVLVPDNLDAELLRRLRVRLRLEGIEGTVTEPQ